jgi:hypothetical protein
MNKKGSMELGVNSIVILVIAIVMLGLILGIIVPKIKNASTGLEAKEPDAAVATASDPITMSRTEISAYAGDETLIKVGLYNPTGAPLATPVAPQILTTGPTACSALATDVHGIPKTIGAAEQAQYTLNLKIKKTVGAGTYICSLDPMIPGLQPIDFAIKILK